MNPDCAHSNLGGRRDRRRSDRREGPGLWLPELPFVAASRFSGGLTSAALRAVGGLSRHCRRRAAIRKLRAMSDAALRDIGLDRSQVVSPVEALLETSGRPL